MMLIEGNETNITSSNDDEEHLYFQAIQIGLSTVLPMALRVAIDLDLLEIIAKARPQGSKLSPTEITSHLPTKNPDAPSIIDRILRLLASHSIVTCDLATSKEGHAQRLYGLAPITKYFLHNDDGVSLVPHLTMGTEKSILESWYHLKEATLEGDAIPVVKAHGMHLFELGARNDEINAQINKSMTNITSIVMGNFLGIYKGFEGINQVVDVGGGLGTNLKLIISKYPQIAGINFDLPHVIKDAPHFPGIEHVGGDMFIEVPQGELIFLKSILHDWSDDRCLKLLKNCYNSIPEFGKVVILEMIAPDSAMTDTVSKNTLMFDLGLLLLLPGAKERTKQEFEGLATKAGFTSFTTVCGAYGYWVMELHKGSRQ